MIFLYFQEINRILELDIQDHRYPIYTLPVNLFMDDTSANKSKKWKALHCVQMQLAGLPKVLKQDPQTVKFISASTDVPILEMVRGILCDINDSKG